MTVPTLFVTGPVGVGKTTVASELLGVCIDRDVPSAFVDVDALTAFHPRPSDDPWGERFALETLAEMVRRLQPQRMIVARVLENRDQLNGYRAAIPGADITVVRLTAPVEVLHERVRRREVGAELQWHLDRAVQLDAQWRARPVEDVLVETGGRGVREIAEELYDVWEQRWT